MDSIQNLLVDIKGRLEREIVALRRDLEREVGTLRHETREGFAQVGKRLDRVEATMLDVDGRLTAMSRADIQTDRHMNELLTRQHAQQQSIDEAIRAYQETGAATTGLGGLPRSPGNRASCVRCRREVWPVAPKSHQFPSGA
jgi:hypothetical protein